MSTKVTARGVVGSLRLLGVTAAVAAGIAGFAPVQQTEVATTDVAVVAKHTQLSQVFKLPQVRQLQQQVCTTLARIDRVPAVLNVLLGCTVTPPVVVKPPVVTPPVVTPPVVTPPVVTPPVVEAPPVVEDAPVVAPPVVVIEGPGEIEGPSIFF
jgi:hypothetical protein